MPVIVNCAWCGKEVRKVPAKVLLVNFCSRQCSGNYRRGKPFHTQDAKNKISLGLTGLKNAGASNRLKNLTRERHPRWRGDAVTKSSGRHRAQNWYPIQPCEVCGQTPDGRHVHRHHKDGNPLNNLPENISFLCIKHHKEIHRKEMN